MNPKRSMWTTLAIAALVAVANRPARAADPVPDSKPAPAAASTSLDGIWMFDATHSDDPMKVMQAARGQNGGGEGGRRGGSGGGGMGGGFGGGRRGGGGGGWGGRGGGGGGENGGEADRDGGTPPDAQRGPSPMARIMRPAHKLVIEMQPDQVLVAEDEAVSRPYAIADSLKAHGHELLTENTSARWKSNRLEMTQTIGTRGKLVETYELSRDGKTLTIRARREGGPEGRPSLPEIARVYTRYEGD